MARKRSNDAVRAYHTIAERFPIDLVARFFGFEESEYLDYYETLAKRND